MMQVKALTQRHEVAKPQRKAVCHTIEVSARKTLEDLPDGALK